MENKRDIVSRLKLLLIATRAGQNIERLELSEDEKTVVICFISGGSRVVNVECDSGIALIKDVCGCL